MPAVVNPCLQVLLDMLADSVPMSGLRRFDFVFFVPNIAYLSIYVSKMRASIFSLILVVP